jgi:hypothetical protein
MLDGMVVVASGQSATIKLWSAILRRIRIQYAIAHCHYDDLSAPTDHAEIWVEREDAEIARSALRPNRGRSNRLGSICSRETVMAYLETQQVPLHRDEA